MNQNIKYFNAHPQLLAYQCEICNGDDAEMRVTSSVANDMGLYDHVCSSCGANMALPKMYPYVVWERGERINTL